jgi:hypothetical protein
MPYIGVGWLKKTSPTALRTLTCAGIVATDNLRHYRRTAQIVLRLYAELEDGFIQTVDGRIFDERVVEYRIDVDLALRKFNPKDVEAVLLVNRDGLTHALAIASTGIKTDRPDRYIADVESRMGQVFARLRLDEFLNYVDYLRQ